MFCLTLFFFNSYFSIHLLIFMFKHPTLSSFFCPSFCLSSLPLHFSSFPFLLPSFPPSLPRPHLLFYIKFRKKNLTGEGVTALSSPWPLLPLTLPLQLNPYPLPDPLLSPRQSLPHSPPFLNPTFIPPIPLASLPPCAPYPPSFP